MDAAFTHRIAPRADLLFPGDTTNGGQNRTDGKLTAAAAPASCCMPQPNRRVIAPPRLAPAKRLALTAKLPVLRRSQATRASG